MWAAKWELTTQISELWKRKRIATAPLFPCESMSDWQREKERVKFSQNYISNTTKKSCRKMKEKKFYKVHCYILLCLTVIRYYAALWYSACFRWLLVQIINQSLITGGKGWSKLTKAPTGHQPAICLTVQGLLSKHGRIRDKNNIIGNGAWQVKLELLDLMLHGRMSFKVKCNPKEEGISSSQQNLLCIIRVICILTACSCYLMKQHCHCGSLNLYFFWFEHLII